MHLQTGELCNLWVQLGNAATTPSTHSRLNGIISGRQHVNNVASSRTTRVPQNGPCPLPLQDASSSDLPPDANLGGGQLVPANIGGGQLVPATRGMQHYMEYDKHELAMQLTERDAM